MPCFVSDLADVRLYTCEMSTKDTEELLRAFTEKGSEDAFQEVVARYIDLVYSVALRRVGGNTHQAQDVVQTVFIDFAGKARSLSSGVQLGGWLHRHACFVAGNFTRAERRRQAREQIAVQMNTLSDTHDASWDDVAPVLDDAVDQLDDPDRTAVLLRFYEQYDLRRLGAALGIGEDAAQKRVSRALDKLRELLARRGVALSAIALASVLATHVVIAAPLGLAQAVVSKSFAKAIAGAGVFAGLLGLLTSTTMKVGICVLALVAVIATVKWRQNQSLTADHPELPLNELIAGQVGVAGTTGQVSVTNEPAIDTAVVEGLPATPEIIRLTILAADSGKPVPSVLVDYRGWVGKKFTGKKITGNRNGICDVTVSRETLTDLQLTTRTDGFADTRLFWRPDRGERIPTNYTVRLDRSVPISGRVVDADNQPVEGAKVGFNHEAEPASEIPPQDHQFIWIEVLTDSEGHWKIDRIAAGMIRRIYGSARHSNHVSSSMIFAARDREAEQQLLEGTHVFRLGRSIKIRGMVVGPDDQPVSGARVFVGGRGESGKRESITGVDGSFSIPGCKPGKNLVTAEAAEFAPVTVQIEAALDAEPIRLKLEQGAALILRVVDRMNRPVPGTFIWLRTSNRGLVSASNLPPVQASFNPKTEADGRAVWTNAPNREMLFDFQAAGFMRLDEVKLRPDGQEHVITLPPALTVHGSVRDENGSPVPRFRIISGWPSGPAEGDVMWSTLDRFWLSFAGGEYRHTFEEPVVGGTANRGYVLKFEAENYAPFVSRVIGAEEGEARVDVTLRSGAASAKVTVLLPNGRAAHNADVGFVSPGSRLQLVPGGFSRENVQDGNALRRTDAKGQFQIKADPGISRIIAAHPDGYAETSPEALAAEPVIRLQPWGRIEGTYLVSGKLAAGRLVRLQLGFGDFMSVSADLHKFQTSSDAQGQFTFPQAPPGKHHLVRLLPQTNGTTVSWMNRPLEDVEVVSGETKMITVGGVGYTVTARVRWPEGFRRGDSWRVFGAVTTPFLQPPAEAASNPEALAKWRSSPEIQTLLSSVRRYQMTEVSDGVWQAEEVPAGQYNASFSALSQPGGDGAGAVSLNAGTTLIVPVEPPMGTIDLGEITLRNVER
jgi:RNA polymerase sigma factor (sigma-70 family)